MKAHLPTKLILAAAVIVAVIVMISVVGSQSILSITNSYASVIANSDVASNRSKIGDIADAKLPYLMDKNLTVKVVAQGLNRPTSMAFLGKDDFIILQKNGSLIRIVDGAISNKTRLDVPVAKGFYQGLLGIAIANQSNLHGNPYVFLYYTEVANDTTTSIEKSNKSQSQHILGNRVYRYDFINDKLINPRLILDLPADSLENIGGYMTIGPDNNLYVVIGEVVSQFNETAVQTLTQNYVNSSIVDGRAGILRVTLDGNPVLDKGHGILGDTNPLNLYYAYGIHNGFGMDFDPITGKMWDTETGHWINDEINTVGPGFNSGYGIIQGLGVYFPAAPFALVNFNGSGSYHDPEFVWTTKVVPTGLKFLTSEKLGSQYYNDIFVGAFLDGRLYHFKLNSDRYHLSLPSGLTAKVLQNWNSTGYEDIVFGTGFGGISNLSIGPDGYLYVVSVDHGKVYKIMPEAN